MFKLASVLRLASLALVPLGLGAFSGNAQASSIGLGVGTAFGAPVSAELELDLGPQWALTGGVGYGGLFANVHAGTKLFARDSHAGFFLSGRGGIGIIVTPLPASYVFGSVTAGYRVPLGSAAHLDLEGGAFVMNFPVTKNNVETTRGLALALKLGIRL
ncbi:hypothetical protein HNR42_000511 [Deinobacterium chartae]|uniref:Outer membrane protein beta-barrel domain-containing protein n=1 Tax=Deinobacterium chartae TaxID=521158 RepID=A0A841HUR4_9DEIO|nr:hypothetical protein [Deinobacterium chartae]MBB6097097.1 hypothetical protein [Deinobacterium chartae]